MQFFFSRRAFNAESGKFSNNAARLTRYVRMAPGTGGAGRGNIVARDQWVSEVVGAAATPDVLIYVHGFNTSQSRMLERLNLVETGLRGAGYRGAVVGFDWPSDGSFLRYEADRSDAKRVAGAFVTEGVQAIQAAAPGHRVHVLTHSMGAYVVLRGFAETPGAWRVDQAVFVAADVPVVWLASGAWGALVMERHAARLTNYYSTQDDVLSLSGGFINGGAPRAGRRGLPSDLPARAEDIYATAQYQRHVADKSLVRSHGWYFEDAGFFRDVAATLSGAPAQPRPTRRPTDQVDLALLT